MLLPAILLVPPLVWTPVIPTRGDVRSLHMASSLQNVKRYVKYVKLRWVDSHRSDHVPVASPVTSRLRAMSIPTRHSGSAIEDVYTYIYICIISNISYHIISYHIISYHIISYLYMI